MGAEKDNESGVTYFLIFENLRPTGGVRQALVLALELAQACDVVLCIVRREIISLRSIAGFFKDLVIAYQNKPKGVRLRVLCKPLEAMPARHVITTSKSTLKWVKKIDSPWHSHYFQHIEVWGTLNSIEFERFCESNGYPDSREFGLFLSDLMDDQEREYLAQLENVRNFFTVSAFLKRFLTERSPGSAITIKSVFPHIRGEKGGSAARDIDLLFFLRGLRFKGDDLTTRLIKYYAAKGKKIAVVVSLNLPLPASTETVRYFIRPSDSEVAELYSRARLTVHASLLEGFGSVPQEAAALGSAVVCSNTGWLLDDVNDSITKISHHRLDDYVDVIDRVLEPGTTRGGS